jgi:O-antigen/teichoic acid export membrane protein
MSGAGATSAGAVATETAGLRRILSNAGSLFGAYVAPRGLTFAAALLAARLLEPAAFGAYGAAAAIAMMLSILCTLGMLPLLVRDIARSPQRGAVLVAAAVRIRIAGAGLMFVTLLLAAALLRFPTEVTAAALLLCAGHACWAVAESYGARIQAEERMHVWLRANLVFGAAAALLSGSAVLMTRSVPWFCAGFAAGQALAMAYLIRREPVVLAAHERIATEMRRLLRATAPFAAAFLLLTLFYKFDVPLLARLGGAHEAGIYAAAYKLVDVVHALAVVAAAAVYPRLARAGGADAARRTLELLLLLAVPGAGLLWLLRTPLTTLLFGAAYDGADDALLLLAPATVLLTLNIAAGYVLAVAHHVPALAIAYAAALLGKVALCVTWMPVYGPVGAAGAMLGGELIAAAALATALRGAHVPLPRGATVRLAGAATTCILLCGLIARVAPPAATAILMFAALTALYAMGGALSSVERATLFAALRAGRSATEAA